MSAPNIRTGLEQCEVTCLPLHGIRNGDVHRCDHGYIWVGRAAINGMFWKHLDPFWNRRDYKRAKQALDAAG